MLLKCPLAADKSFPPPPRPSDREGGALFDGRRVFDSDSIDTISIICSADRDLHRRTKRHQIELGSRRTVGEIENSCARYVMIRINIFHPYL